MNGMIGIREIEDAKPLPMLEYKNWFEALRFDDVSKVRAMLTEADEQEKDRLLHGKFAFDRSNSFAKHVRPTGPYLPLTMAAIYGSYNVIPVLFRHGVSVKCLEIDRMNLFHSLVLASFHHPKTEKVLVETYQYLTSFLSEEVVRMLLMSENAEGLRPLEFAAQQGTLRLFFAILQTKGTYLSHEEVRVGSTYHWYDITEYEEYGPGGRRHKSPMLFLAHLDKKKIKDPVTSGLFSCDILAAWHWAKFQTHWPFMLFWLVLRMVYITSFFVYDSNVYFLQRRGGISESVSPEDRMNASSVYCQYLDTAYISPGALYILMGYTMVQSIFIIIFDVWGICALRMDPKKQLLHRDHAGSKNLVMSFKFMRAVHLLCAVCFLLIPVFYMLSIHLSIDIHEALDLLRVSGIAMCQWSILFFVQGLPTIGVYIVTIQRLLKDLLHFVIVSCIFYAMFSHIFFMLINTYSRQACIEEFSNPARALYSTFTMMLNMIDLDSMDLIHTLPVFFCHVLYTFTVSILLINFLIATLSNSVSELSEYKEVILVVQRLSVLYQLEDNLAPCFWRLFNQRVQKAYECIEGHVYLRRKINNSLQNNENSDDY